MLEVWRGRPRAPDVPNPTKWPEVPRVRPGWPHRTDLPNQQAVFVVFKPAERGDTIHILYFDSVSSLVRVGGLRLPTYNRCFFSSIFKQNRKLFTGTVFVSKGVQGKRQKKVKRKEAKTIFGLFDFGCQVMLLMNDEGLTSRPLC